MGVRERRDRDFRRREEEILTAALGLCGRDDWQAVTVERIAQAAEIGKGTVYKHFRTKDEIYGRLALTFHARLLHRLRSLDESVDALARLRDVIREVGRAHRLAAEYRPVVEYCDRADFRQAVGEPVASELAACEHDLATIVGALIQAGIDRRLFPRRPVAVLQHGVLAVLAGAVHHIRRTDLAGPELERYLDDVADFVVAGLVYQGRVGEE